MTNLDPSLRSIAEKSWQRLVAKDPSVLELSADQQQQTQIAFAMSDFIAETCISRPQYLHHILEQQSLDKPWQAKQQREQLQQALSEQINDEGAKVIIRRARQQSMLIFAWRELCHNFDVQQSMKDISDLAQVIIQCAYEWLFERCKIESGTPLSKEGVEQQLLIIGMGKLGGGELNFSSDIDLIFCFGENGETKGGRRSIANQQFFIRLGQRLIQLLDQKTADGFAYRVDMRLRPFGDSGPLAVSYAALEDYYQHHGRDWERYAMVKARVLNSEVEFDQQFRDLLRPFVYRRYIDFSAIQSLRAMKASIRSEVRRKGLKDNIKLGSGGIREIEFVVQAFQLVRAGREPILSSRSLLPTLTALESTGVMSSDEVALLRSSYLYLRRVENILQQIGDQQTQSLPIDAINQQRLVQAMQCQDWPDFYQQLQTVLQGVAQVFAHAVGEDETEQSEVCTEYEDVWHSGADREALRESLAKVDLDPAISESAIDPLYHLFHAIERRNVGERGRQTLERLIPMLLFRVFEHKDCQLVLPRITSLLESIMSRTAYLELLTENPATLNQLLRLCAGSQMLAKKLSRFPILLDELLDPKLLYSPADPNSYPDQLRQFMLRVPVDDMEQQMEAHRQFKQIQQLRITAADIAGALPLMKVSDHLTAVAQAIISAVVELAWQQMIERYGQPAHLSSPEQRGFAVIAYGKIGGFETGYGSDLDLVFVHDCETNAPTLGEKPIESKQFYIKLAQRIMHLCSTRTSSGVLYELDMRLRPSGASGLLVIHVDSFADYQNQEAWTWEHQALVRARPIYGDQSLFERFASIRHSVLSRPRLPVELGEEVSKMRAKMRKHLSRETDEIFDLKHSAGGMVDIEFIAQYLVLANTAQHEQLSRWTDNVRIFEHCCELGLLSEQDAQFLIQRYLDVRDECHRQALQGNSRIINKQDFSLDLEPVKRIWEQLLPPIEH
ncbi:bifunctional [glutamate--ammonia ligase]-adenylyl-L-tyrosine phosphorylase/[glutamate--ammonia-ligase] adenylyltransferase [Alginatibacterium sediminis]|uniref:Bifunctional glutamine synthetase adenylyltransferase/adenylyl-removing enzyme n=1 Tax=Alginatibacterium sediminis TaxID=2164068 RepID=A0A420ECP8_9ALTE|nr:bifunctional [glutamate--ammonia ligase]-adenylyl-L-tyrosine phosphorylase/[glutamate--ammonia-ligase] adenylyltransferase [Alginatibacterium sediminis]RKF18448.1 bifunctional [glutamate--ammonia ligase]-adenylyl-L-tyrosine phosphorylase/[glutamate--ammonia-ligase] adenylyltransferase [Alginatibacterium sediminis]